MKCSPFLFLILALIYCTNTNAQTSSLKKKWTNILDADLTKWEKFIGVPHTSLELDGYPKGDGMKGIPMGLNKDP
ncbi:MAG: hypothetical protein H7Y07_07320, partial [Pyrinomonadaceae bacterium]|nr:hypothetical protein [Sphingobacteriaceae bacterium]